tara:strand:+ start:129 stop:428 length:300 start_codon:yes stop_codon:yes gene_type:complete
MKLNYHDDNECFLLFGKDLNKIIAMLQIFSDRNPSEEKLKKFIEQLRIMRSYDEMLDEMIMTTRMEDMSKKDQGDGGLTLNEILSNLDIRKWEKGDGKN